MKKIGWLANLNDSWIFIDGEKRHKPSNMVYGHLNEYKASCSAEEYVELLRIKNEESKKKPLEAFPVFKED